MSLENFKKFVKDKPNLQSFVAKGEMSWQDFYNMYELGKGDFYKEQFPTTKVYKEEYAFVYKIREQIPKAVR